MPPTLSNSHASRRFAALALFLILFSFGIYSTARASGAGRDGAAQAIDIKLRVIHEPGRFFSPLQRGFGRWGAPLQTSGGGVVLVQAATPSPSASPSPAPLPTETQTPHGKPTRTPRPTSTPPTIPPPQDPGATRMMVGFGVLIVIVILFGLWLNRKNAF
jgi:hypothetical protein